MREQNLQLVRQKCIEANPEARWYMSTLHGPGLADVLLAIQAKKLDYAVMVDQEGGFVTAMQGQPPMLYSVFKGWNLHKDDLTEQTDECLEFLAQLLK